MDQITKLDWTRYNLIRINKLASGDKSCPKLIDELPIKEINPILQKWKEDLSNRLSDDNIAITSIVNQLEYYPTNSLGNLIYLYYLNNKVPFAGSAESEFPARYIFLHDAHHVLINQPVNHHGEMNVVAFEGALCGRNAESLMPILTQMWAFSACENYEPDFVSICHFWQIGTLVKGDLIETWEIEKDLELDIQAVKNKYNICI